MVTGLRRTLPVVAGFLLIGVVLTLTQRPATADVNGPKTCQVSEDGASLNVTWQAVVGVSEFVIYRSVNGSENYWRGRATDRTFTDSNRSGSIKYSVASRGADGTRSTPTTCGAGNTPAELEPVPACTASVAGSAIDVRWSTAAGAAEYVVARSVNQSPNYWRARTADLSFTDSNRSGSIKYTVQAKAANGSLASRTTCSTGGGVEPVASCTSAVNAGAIDISWGKANGAADYVISRRINRGETYWRGLTSDLSFRDSYRSGSIDYLVTSRAADGAKSAATACGNGAPPNGDGIDLIAVGDMATCGNDGADEVSALLDTMPGRIVGLGDFVYPDGTPEEFAECFDPKLGRHKSRFDPIVGNHEYYTPNAAGYFGYFGKAAGDPDKGYYARTEGNWQIVYLNSECGEVGGCNPASPQYRWLKSTLASAPEGTCRIAAWHNPRWSSYGPYASRANLDPMLSLLHAEGTDILLTGHAHMYERLAQVNPDRQLDNAGGFRQFTVGTGGVVPRTPDPADRLDVSEKLIAGSYGVLDLDLNDDSFDFRFVGVDGKVLDSGSDSCVNS